MSQVKRWNSMPVSNMASSQRAATQCAALFSPQRLMGNTLKVTPQIRIDACLCLTWGYKAVVTEQVKGHPCLSFYLTQADTCCVNWQVGSWGKSPNLLVLELEPRGQIHFTLRNPWLSVHWCLLQSLNVRQRLPLCVLYYANWEGAFMCSNALKHLPIKVTVASGCVVQSQWHRV